MNTIKSGLGIILISLMFPFACSSNIEPKPSPKVASSPSPTVIPVENSNIEYIKTGTSFGHCLGYCQEIFTITSDKINYVAKINGEPLPAYPEITRNDPFTETDYNNLVKLIDLNNFKTLPERIGCPDCADGGAEWIEIKYGNTVKKVEFEFNKPIDKITSLLEKLRALRNEHTNPYIINRSIAAFMKEPVKNPPIVINQYDYKGKKVYFIPSYCCDIESKLYDADSNLVCSPDGGITGKGDGKCIDFFSERKNEKLIWKDDRK